MKNKYTDMSRAELAAAYVDKVGYDPFQDDPQTTEAEIAQTLAEWGTEWLNLTFGRHQGLNADWSVQAWRVCGQMWIIDNEDGTFSFAQRTPTADGGWNVDIHGEIKL